MKYEVMKPLEGKYVFLVVSGGRSFQCDILRVDEKKVWAVEVNHSEWPGTVRKVALESITYVFEADVVYEKGGDATEFFSWLRPKLNKEDALP